MNAAESSPLARGAPLLIAIHGPSGSAKTAMAAQFVNEMADDLHVAGWLQPLHKRDEADRAADCRRCQPINGLGEEGGNWRDNVGRLQPQAVTLDDDSVMDSWLAATLADSRTIDVLVIDGIGPAEVSGGGNRSLIEALFERAPKSVVVVVNTDHLQAVAEMLGQRLDVIVSADDPRALQRLREVLSTRRDFESVGLFGALAGAFEIGAGSVVHGANIPFGGLGMATTQSAVLTRAAQPLTQRSRVAWVAVLSAAIKSLSPAGQRLRPMLAIVVQGWLFSRALSVFGWNRFGVVTGGLLMGLWAGSQGLVTQWLLLGDAFAVALNKLNQEASALLGWSAPSLLVLIMIWLGLHGSVVAVGTALAWRRPISINRKARLPAWLTAQPVIVKRRWRASMTHALAELARPVFWLPLVLVLSALAWAGQSNETLVWVSLRAILIGWVVFMLVQRLDLVALPATLRRFGMWGPAIAWQRALAGLSSPSSK